jgi:hypothetical protein
VGGDVADGQVQSGGEVPPKDPAAGTSFGNRQVSATARVGTKAGSSEIPEVADTKGVWSMATRTLLGWLDWTQRSNKNDDAVVQEPAGETKSRGDDAIPVAIRDGPETFVRGEAPETAVRGDE